MDRIRFLHIPKTAGTSFSNCLRRIYKANRLRHNVFVFQGDLEPDLERYRQLDLERRAGITLFTGHAPLTTGAEEIDRLPTITFLRNPVERVKSFLQYAAEGKVRGVAPEKPDIDALLTRARFQLENFYARMLLGNRRCDGGWDGEAMAEEALDLLANRLASFGITERFDDSLLLFQHVLDWKTSPVYTRLNEKSGRDLLSFSEAQMERIREWNSVDLRIYEGAECLFRERLETHATELEPRRRAFAIRQTLAQPFLGLYKLYHTSQTLLARNRR